MLCGYLCGRGSLVYNPPTDVCSYFNCIPNFPNGTGYMVECNDGMYSMSGGRPGHAPTTTRRHSRHSRMMAREGAPEPAVGSARGQRVSNAWAVAATLALTLMAIVICTGWLLTGASLAPVLRNSRVSRIMNITLAVTLVGATAATGIHQLPR